MEDRKVNNQDNKPLALDDEQRIKVLSPGMLVIKRFIRNRLAVVGLSIIAFMVLFSFLGGVLMPYQQQQTFYTYEKISQEFAGVTINDNYMYTVKGGESFPAAAQPFFIKALTDGAQTFSASGADYALRKEGEDDYIISVTEPLGSILAVGSNVRFTPAEGVTADQNLIDAAGAAIAENQAVFELDGNDYSLTRAGKTYQLSIAKPIAMASKMIFDMANPGDSVGYEFKHSAERAFNAGEQAFAAGDAQYLLKNVQHDSADIYVQQGGEEQVFARMSKFLVKATANDIFLTLGFKAAVEQAVELNQQFFEYADAGEESAEYELVRKNTEYLIRRTVDSKLLKEYALPSSEHWMGTDEHGMDILTRLMYGGRISLTVGIVVVLIEILIGVTLGGIAGYFGGWVDNLLMRLVDIFNCLPYLPLMIIVGAIMDGMRVNPMYRIYVLMAMMGLLGWPYSARMVRGQILSLREQEFMIAAEASGLSVGRRIFKHLIPNVIPQLIVIATMGLGDIILTESTLSFLGLGVKYPMASWGNIINSVSNVFVMANYWFAWIPAGMLILLTVLGFNFIGDGLRDAFDPKMKR